jgi:clan AA aspartic protease (TIGR02281 family)
MVDDVCVVTRVQVPVSIVVSRLQLSSVRRILLASALAVPITAQAVPTRYDQVGAWDIAINEAGNCYTTATYASGTRLAVIFVGAPQRAEQVLRIYTHRVDRIAPDTLVPVSVLFALGNFNRVHRGQAEILANQDGSYLAISLDDELQSDFQDGYSMQVTIQYGGSSYDVAHVDLKDTSNAIDVLGACQTKAAQVAQIIPTPTPTPAPTPKAAPAPLPSWAPPNWTPPSLPSPASTPTRIPLQRDNAGDYVEATVNGTQRVRFILDTGCSDVSLSQTLVARLRAEGSLTAADSLGTATFSTANGKVQGERFLLRSLQVGSRTVYKVVGSVTYSTASDDIMLLGQTFLRKFKSWSIDNGKAELVLE